MSRRAVKGHPQLDFGGASEMPAVAAVSPLAAFTHAQIIELSAVTKSLQDPIHRIVTDDHYRAEILHSMGLCDLNTSTRAFIRGQEIYIFLPEDEWSGFITKPHLSSFSPTPLTLQLDVDNVLFPITFLNFGKGDLSIASDEWLANVQSIRCAQPRYCGVTPSIKELFFRTSFNEETNEIFFRAPHEIAIENQLNSLSSITLGILKTEPRNRFTFGPLTVTDIKHNYHGQIRFELSDGHQSINSNFVGVDSDHKQIALGDVVWIDGSLKISRDGDTLDLKIYKITRFLDEPVPLSFSVDLSDIEKTRLVPTWTREHVTSQSELTNFLATIKKETRITLDIETHRDEHNPKLHNVTLIQVGVPAEQKCYLLEGDAINQMSHLKEWLEDESQEKVIHYAKFEKKRFLENDIHLGNVVDTWELIQRYLPHIQNRQLGNALYWLCNIEMDKTLQGSTWLPPFSSQQYDYAQLDVELLSLLHDNIEHLFNVARTSIDREGSLSSLMESLYDTDKEISERIAKEHPRLIEVQNELDNVSSSIVSSLQSGVPRYNGPYGSFSLGYFRSLLDSKKVKTILKQKKILSGELEKAFNEKLRISISEVRERVQRCAGSIDPSFIEEVLQNQKAVDIEPSYVISTSFTPPVDATAKKEHTSPGKDIIELAKTFNSLHSEMLTTLHRDDSLLLSMLVRRSILWNEVTSRLNEGESYKGPFGEAYIVNTQMGVSVPLLHQVIEKLSERDKVSLKEAFASTKPWLTKESFNKLLEEEGIIIEPEEIRKLNYVASIYSKKRGDIYLRPGSAKK